MSIHNDIHEINGVPVGNSLWNHMMYGTFVEDPNPRDHFLTRGGNMSSGNIRSCFFCGDDHLFIKDYCEKCYNEFILGRVI